MALRPAKGRDLRRRLRVSTVAVADVKFRRRREGLAGDVVLAVVCVVDVVYQTIHRNAGIDTGGTGLEVEVVRGDEEGVG